MNTPTRLALFAAGLAAVLAAGAGLGAAVGPAPARDRAEPAPEGEGVVAALDGYRLVTEDSTLPAAGGPFRFVIEGPSGRPETAFRLLHERRLHLVVVNRELTSFHHVHPDLAADGTWSVDLPALAAGSYRAVADFRVADGPRLALGTDVGVGGPYQPVLAGAPTAVAEVDGYEVALATQRGDGGAVTATLTVRRGGHPVFLQPYLGARGHLVAMRSGDLAYAHVHPLEDDSVHEQGQVAFEATLASAGRYALFLDFRHGDAVHTARFLFDQGRVDGSPTMEH